MNQSPECPLCGLSDYTAKVSVLFLEGIQRSQKKPKTNPDDTSQESAHLPVVYQSMPASTFGQLSHRLKPPESGSSQSVRPVHPDLVVIAFSLFAPFFIYQIVQNQPVSILPVLLILAAFYGFYFWKRKNMVRKYLDQVRERKEQTDRVKEAIQHWIRLYYCARDDCVFEPGTEAVIPTDQMKYFLLKNK